MVLDHRHCHHRMLLDAGPTPPQNNVNRTRSYTSEANFDTNMVIILVALLCALICTLGLNSIVRCALRCSQQFAFETPDQTTARIAATGLKKSVLRRIPVAVYGSGSNIPETECPICLGEFLDGEKVRRLPRCHHRFHIKCIDTWQVSHSLCPTCRQSLLEPPAAPEAVAVAVARDGHLFGQQVSVSVQVDEVG